MKSQTDHDDCKNTQKNTKQCSQVQSVRTTHTAVAPYPLYDLTASGITSTWSFACANSNRVQGPVMENHFGVVDILWGASLQNVQAGDSAQSGEGAETDTVVHLRIIDVHNQTRISHRFPLGDLTFEGE